MKDLLTILENVFKNPNRRLDAERKLATLRQEGRDFATFYAKFQRYAAEAMWTDEQRLPSLHQGISFELETALAYSDRDPKTLTEWVALCQRLDNKIRSLKTRQNVRTSNIWRTPTSIIMTTTMANTRVIDYDGISPVSKSRANRSYASIPIRPSNSGWGKRCLR